MGDRVVFSIKQADGNSINLYSHWGGYDRFRALAAALEKSRPRWTDESYGIRIIVSQLIGDQWDTETGFGLWAATDLGAYFGGDHPDLVIDMLSKTIEDETGTHTFEQFIAFHGSLSLTEQA